MNALLGENAPSFWDELETGSPVAGLRVNPAKIGLSALQDLLSLEFQPLPWTALGVAVPSSEGLGKHPFHKAGLYYLQEPSAMAPAAVLDPQPGERVLDLCAAPGGKTTQIQARMKNQGLLIANDANPRRVQALARNIERWGARNSPVLCETPRRISEHLGAFFDRVLVDAPCSGEGTFRSEPGEIKKWSPEFSERCCRIQDEILWFAAKSVRPGGVLVYSTCTFNQDENEGTIARFLEKNPDFKIDPIQSGPGYSPGLPLAGSPGMDFSGTVRIWPHLTQAEGHFIARLRKSAASPEADMDPSSQMSFCDQEQLLAYQDFYTQTLTHTPRTDAIHPENGGINSFGNRLYWIPQDMPALEGLNVRHWGWWLGSVENGKFNPSPALAAALDPEDAQMVLEFSLEDARLAGYLRGSPTSGFDQENLPEGWVLVTCSGYPLGWGAARGGRLKSHFPRWLRTN